jgi:sarcosine oxidase subunit gamma
MSKLCGVDMSEKTFTNGDVLQTQVARLSAVLVNTGTPGEKCFELLYDRCSSKYMTDVVEDALAEFNA